MEEFTSRYRSVSILLGVLFLQFVLLGYQVKRGENVQLGRGWATAVMAPFQTALSGGVGTAGSLWKDYLWLYGVREANERLLSENKELRSRVQQLGVALSRFSREEELLTYQKQSPSQTLLARVIGVGSHPNAREISIDKGTGDGVKAGMAAITPDGVAGVVQAAYPQTSLVLLINDVDSGVGVILQHSRSRGIMKGLGASECRVEYVKPEFEVSLGETVFTSGDDRIYPKGLPVGEVTAVNPGPENQEILVRPFARLHRLEEVLIVTSGVHQDLPRYAGPQAPEYLMPPPAPPAPLSSRPASENRLTAASPANTGEPAAPVTGADTVKERYQAIGAAQRHQFGEGVPGSPPPDFNIGLTPAAAPADPRLAPLPGSDVPAAGSNLPEEGASTSSGPDAPRAPARQRTQRSAPPAAEETQR